MKAKDHKGLAISPDGFWTTSNRENTAEAARLATQRCSDLVQTPCLLISIDGLPTQRLPATYTISAPFTLAGENDIGEADKARIAAIYTGSDWRALARGMSKNWYAVNNASSETAAVEQALKLCADADTGCDLYAIGNFRVGKPKE